ncbi:Eco57I restriction-modification methylase domain-containing protein [Halorientalis regularis]|uniref:site-specific DNA-methyltransferase (adenine-specific) n=1 Tax=Halorientalis regularis TaxID=660518 RepID=A0A1G7RKP5_9EURY|nr:N-6 DNA methylase [Halorientalis regularis]SDG11287.1 N-6 DNA Methylase [Halorientalis regularis]
MSEGPAGLDGLVAAVAEAAGDRSRPDWLATATDDATVRERLATLGRAAADDGAADAYQRSLPAERRRADGHFVTDPAVAAACCRWAIQPRPDDSLPRVLDPAVGSGVFPVAATRRLAALAPESTPADRLERIVGVDTDPVPLALAANRLLAAADPGPDARCRLYESDFFAVDPGPDRTSTVTDDRLVAGQFDAVVGNPPYVRQETTDIDRARDHLAAFGPDGQRPYLDGDRALSRRSDAYVYFVTHATRFLREGGRLAVVVPNKWLTTRYGASFQRFLFDHYRLAAVVGFGAAVFDDAFVDAVLLLAERCPDPERRRSTPVRFCRLDEQVSVDRLLDLIDADSTPPDDGLKAHATEAYRRVTVRQGRLADRESAKLAAYLDAPEPFIRLLSNPSLVPLSDRCTVSRGVMTGANDFFFLDADGWATEVDDRFLEPAIKSIRDVDGPRVTVADTDRYLLDVHEYVREVRADRDDEPDDGLDAAVVRALDRDGYDALADYVAWGERQGFASRRSCASRRVWFDLGPLSAPAVFVPKFFDRRVPVVANPDGLLASNAVDCLWVDGPGDSGNTGQPVDETTPERATLGVLNATVTAGILECWGRSEGGGALQVMTYELASLPIPDPLAMAPDTRREVAAAADALLAGEDGARDRLDRLVLDAIDADLGVEACRRHRTAMVERRAGTSDSTAAPLTRDSGQR